MSGVKSYQNGLSAEEIAERAFTEIGGRTLAKRWRRRGGEIDLIAERNGVLHFVEVKASSTWARAAERLLPRQMQRIQSAALEYLAESGSDLDKDMQFDVVLVDGQGRAEIVQNAFNFPPIGDKPPASSRSASANLLMISPPET